ncbi:hypothetical protein MW887_011451 [Aspergillus wentii]|nr:hypothetical protein MW887_011451 [Aspergillus wentii]
MGISSSQPEPQLPEGFTWPPHPQNRQELRDRYGYNPFESSGFKLEQRRRLEVVFDTFCTFWSESNLTDFLQSTFPQEIAPILLDAIPVLHRFLLRLGSFPYQNDPDKLLTLDVLRMAVILMLIYDSERAEADGPDTTLEYDTSFADFRRVAFQSLATLDPFPSKQLQQRQRDEEDDFHLERVIHRINKEYNWQNPEDPKCIIFGPELSVSDYASSWSNDLHRLIPIDEWRSLLRLLLVSQLYRGGINPQQFSTYPPQLEHVIDSVLGAFKENTNATGISWEVFDRVVARSMPRFLMGWDRILGPLYSTEHLHEFPASASVSEAQSLFRETYTPLFQREGPKSSLLDLPRLSQLDLLMLSQLQTENASLCWSAGREQHLNLRDLHTAMTDQQTPHQILVISGSSDKDDHVIFGALLWSPPTAANETPRMIVSRIFQLKPVHRSFRPLSGYCFDVKTTPPLLENDPVSIKMTIPMGEKDPDTVDLVLDETSRSGELIMGKSPKIREYFRIDAVEVLRVDKENKPVKFH